MLKWVKCSFKAGWILIVHQLEKNKCSESDSNDIVPLPHSYRIRTIFKTLYLKLYL